MNVYSEKLSSALTRLIFAGEAIVGKAAPLRNTSKTWRAIQKIVKAETPAVQRAFVEAIAKTKAGVDTAALQAAYEAGDLEASINSIPWGIIGDTILRDKLGNVLQRVYAQTGAAVSVAAGYDNFGVVDPRPLKAMQTFGADRVVEISEATRAGLRKTLVAMIDSGMSSTRAVSQIMPQIGLHEAWSEAVANYRDKLTLTGEHSDKAIDTEVARYSNQLRMARALNIARTEPAIAVAAGRRESWDQMIEDGFIDKAVAMRQWMESSNACPEVCAGMDGQVRGLDEPFTGADGSSIDDAGAHVNCACEVELMPEGE